MSLLSPTFTARPRRPMLLPTNPDKLWDLAERLNGRPVPGVRLTERQFVDWCPEDVLAEWVDGEVILVPAETPSHNGRDVLLGSIVLGFVEHHDLGRVFIWTVPVRLPGRRRRRIPDVVFVGSNRLDIIRDTFIDGAPDLVAEVVSPDSVARDWVDKRDDYQRAGVREYWIADPWHERFAAYALHGKAYRPIPPGRRRPGPLAGAQGAVRPAGVAVAVAAAEGGDGPERARRAVTGRGYTGRPCRSCRHPSRRGGQLGRR